MNNPHLKESKLKHNEGLELQSSAAAHSSQHAKHKPQHRFPSFMHNCKVYIVILAYIVGILDCAIFQMLLIGSARIMIDTMDIVIGVSIFLGVVAVVGGCCCCILINRNAVYLSFSRQKQVIKYLLMIVALVGIVPAIGSGVVAAGYFQAAWYYESLVIIPTQSTEPRIDPGKNFLVPNTSKKEALHFEQDAYVNTTFGGYGLFWSTEPEMPFTDSTPTKVICVAPIMSSTHSFPIQYWAVNVVGCCRGFPNISFVDCGWDTMGRYGADLYETDDDIDKSIQRVANSHQLKLTKFRKVEWISNFNDVSDSKKHQGLKMAAAVAVGWPLGFIILFFLFQLLGCIRRPSGTPLKNYSETSRDA